MIDTLKRWIGMGYAVEQLPMPHVDTDPLGNRRSGQWPAVRKTFLAKHPTCAVCGTRESVEAHHLQPFHEHPELELVESNLLALCRDHHLLVGHLMNFRSWNRSAREDAAVWREKIRSRP